MDLTIDEFKSLSADMTGQRMRIAELESELNASRAECAALRQEIGHLQVSYEKTRMENSWLRNYIILSAEKIKVFMAHLHNIDKAAFLKSFIEWTLPKEHYSEQLTRVNELVSPPDEGRDGITNVFTGDHVNAIYYKRNEVMSRDEVHNHFEAGSSSQVFNGDVEGTFKQ